MKHNYHSHTTYCHHSIFSPEELILKAIKENFETFGVSEHAPLPNYIGKWRMKDNKALFEYIKEMQELKLKYKNQIKVLIGLECEITDTKTNKILTDHIKWLSSLEGIDFLILGHHTYDDGAHVYVTLPSRKQLEKYIDRYKKALDLNIFKIVAHPDAIFRGFGKVTDDLLWAAEEIIKYAVEKDIPLGLNVNGLVSNEKFSFPNPLFWKMAAKNGATAILELDAHDHKPFEKKWINKAKKILKESKVKVIESLKL